MRSKNSFLTVLSGRIVRSVKFKSCSLRWFKSKSLSLFFKFWIGKSVMKRFKLSTSLMRTLIWSPT